MLCAQLGRLAILSAISTLFYSCQNEADISEYYFPVNKLGEGKVYEYRFVGKPEVMPEYWLHERKKDAAEGKKGNFFESTLYGANMEVRQFVREEIVSNGVLLDNLQLYFKDSTGNQAQVAPVIISPNVYPFDVKDTTLKYYYKIFFKNPFDTLQTTYLTRSRTFKGKKQYRYKGKEVDCVEFALEEKYVDDREGRWEKVIYGTELYAKGIGLVYYKKGLQKEFTLEYELADIYSPEELKKKLK